MVSVVREVTALLTNKLIVYYAESYVRLQMIWAHLVLGAALGLLLGISTIVLIWVSLAWSWLFLLYLSWEMVFVLIEREALNLVLKTHLVHLSIQHWYALTCYKIWLMWSDDTWTLNSHIDAISTVQPLCLSTNLINSGGWHCNHAAWDPSLHHFICEAESRVWSVVARRPVAVVAILHQLMLMALRVVVVWGVHRKMMIWLIDLFTSEIIQSTVSSSNYPIHRRRTSVVVGAGQMLVKRAVPIVLMERLPWYWMACQVSCLCLE